MADSKHTRGINDARACPLMMGQKCIGNLCELFQTYYNINQKGEKITYERCVFNKTPELLIENANLTRKLIEEQRMTQKLLITIHERQYGEAPAK